MACMHEMLHPQPFTALEAAFDQHGFHDLPLPPDGDAHVEEARAYNEAASAYAAQKREAEDELLLSFNGVLQAQKPA